jgi:hypothetical protein
MVARDGANDASRLARERANIEVQLGELHYAAVWHFIADEIDQPSPKK